MIENEILTEEELKQNLDDDKDITSDIDELQNIYPASINVSKDDNSYLS